MDYVQPAGRNRTSRLGLYRAEDGRERVLSMSIEENFIEKNRPGRNQNVREL